jgi:dTDP-4-dehydrorhamnose 3,5-epimerase-like enzyme
MVSKVEDVQRLTFPELGDERGYLVVIEGGNGVPFEIARVFYIYGSDAGVVRGRHANRFTEFVLINVSGSCRVDVTDGLGNAATYALDTPREGLYLPPMIWKDMYAFSEDSVLLILASDHYDAAEYIRDFDAFMEEVRHD